jgi:hypothetical protein
MNTRRSAMKKLASLPIVTMIPVFGVLYAGYILFLASTAH